MKKILSVITAAVLLLALVALPVSAERKPHFYVTGPSSAKAGDMIKLTVNVEGDYQAHIIGLRLGFDTRAFRYVSYEFGGTYAAIQNADGMASCGLTASGDAVSYGVLMPVEAASVEGALVQVTFEVLSSASSSYTFALSVPEFGYMPLSSTTSTHIDCTVDSFSLTVSGGSGTGNTQTPTYTPKPGTTDQPVPGSPAPVGPGNVTDSPSGTSDVPNITVAPISPDNTQNMDPSVTGIPGETTDTPAVTDSGLQPDTNKVNPQDNTGDNTPGGSGSSDSLKTGLIILGSILAAALVCVCVYFGIRASKEKKGKK